MATKKKKKKSSQNEIAAEKLRLAQYKNEVMGRLRNLCSQIEDESLFDLLPGKLKEWIFVTRGRLKVITAPRKKIPKLMAKYMERGIVAKMKETELELVPQSGKMINMYDYFLVGFTLRQTIDCETAVFNGKERFEAFYKNDTIIDTFFYHLTGTIANYALTFINLDKKCIYDYRIELKVDSRPGYEPVFKLLVIIEPIEFETAHIKVKNENHFAIRVGMLDYGKKENPGTPAEMLYKNIPLRYIQPDTRFPELQVPVFIQLHAFYRLMERICCQITPVVYVTLIKSIENPKVLFTPKGDILIEHNISGIKIGYFYANLIEGKLFIRTFLFITHYGTPEGEKLKELTGLQKNDQKYLALDNLFALANSDILENEAVCDIFRKAGLQSILELCQQVREKNENYFWLLEEHSYEKRTVSSALISEYLKRNTEEDEYIEISE
ncbi:hypothetical protein FACS18945_1850 [Bacteroidia bacterium]|nr:hypothetical protein FACS18945_1850 [Bacteroidia bacterium]